MYVYVEHLTLGCSLLYLNSFVCQQTTQFTSEFAKHQITEHRFIGLTFYDQIFCWLLLLFFFDIFLASSVPNDEQSWQADPMSSARNLLLIQILGILYFE